MIRKIITINEDACIGCGLCANACHESAIAIVDKKAKLLRDDYCDGLGNCLPVCPTNAISFVEREAAAYDKVAVAKRKNEMNTQISFESQLKQWPVQIKLVPTSAKYFDNANLLIAADCTAYAYANFHNEFMKNHVTLIGCPKLDEVNYADKLTEILKQNNIKKITVVRMEVPCCGGIVNAIKQAMINSEKLLPWQVVTISTEGDILDL